MPAVYLAGRMEGRTYDECIKERNKARELLEAHGITAIDPLRGKEFLLGRKISRDEKPGGMNIAEIVARDKYDIRRSDLLFILTGDDISDGTWLEFGYARYKLDIPVIMLAPSRIGKYGWSNYEAAYIAEDLEHAINWIVNYFFFVNKSKSKMA